MSVRPYLHIVYSPCQSLTTEFLAVEAFKLIFIQIEFNTAAIQIPNDRRAFAKEVADPDLKLTGSGSEPREKCGLEPTGNEIWIRIRPLEKSVSGPR